MPLTEIQFGRLKELSGWNLDDVPMQEWNKIPRLERREDIVAILASGSGMERRILNEINAIAGIDVLVAESRPKPGEPEGNAYHYVFAKINDERYPYLMYGPYRSETRIPHWYNATHLDRYWTPSAEEKQPDEEQERS